MRSLRLAFGLLTILPVSPRDGWRAGDSGRVAGWYPAVGLVVGALVWLAWSGAWLLFAPPVAGMLALAVWVALTGGLHLDGLADACDGLFLQAPRPRRLEVMQDPHTGAFGVIGLILILGIKAAALASGAPSMGAGVLLAASLARWCILPAALLPAARPGGLGADFASGLRRGAIALGALIPLGLALAGGWRGLVVLLAGAGAAALVLLCARARIGGVTGDVFGMLVEVVETAALLAAVSG